ALLGRGEAAVDVAALLGAARELRELSILARARDAAAPYRRHAVARGLDARHERVRARLIPRIRLADALGHALTDEARAARRVVELDHERRVAVLAPGDLRAAPPQRRDDDLRERDVRDAMLRERCRELARRHAPHLRRVRAEEEAVERAAHGLDDPVLRRYERPRSQPPADRLERVVEEGACRKERRHRLRDVERLERVLVVLAAELDAHVLRARREAV